MARRRHTVPLSEQDRALFRAEMADVRPLKQDRASPANKPPPPIPRKSLEDERQVIEDMLSDAWDPAELETGEELSFARPGLQHSVLRKLRRGQFSVGAELDLHGLTVPEARALLPRFLLNSRLQGHRCVRIIHGKGLSSRKQQPVLKVKVNKWLPQRDEVLAFCSARPVDGGTGAIYVLLRKLKT